MTSIHKHNRSFLDVQAESEQDQRLHGNGTPAEFVSALPEMGHLDLSQNDCTKLSRVWGKMNSDVRDDFTKKFGDIAHLLFTKVDLGIVRAAIQFWDPTYKCFTLGQQDIMPTMEEYTDMLQLPVVDPYQIFIKARKGDTINKMLRQVTGLKVLNPLEYQMSKENKEYVKVDFLMAFLESNPPAAHAVDTLALAIYGMVIFPKALGYIHARVVELFYRILQKINPVPTILAETFRSLNFCRRKGDGRFIGCLPLLYIWFVEHTRKYKTENVRFRYFRPITEFNERPAPEEQSRSQWIQTFLSFGPKDIAWRAPWTSSVFTLYKCGNRSWIPLPGLWGAVSYAPLQVRRQFGSEQFVPMTHEMGQFDFTYENETFEAVANAMLLEWNERYYVHMGAFLERPTASYLAWSQYKARDIRLPGEDSSIPHATWLPKEKPPTELELAEQRFSEERAAWEVEKTKLTERMMDLEMTIHGKDKKIKEVEEEVRKRDSVIEYTSLTPAAKRKRDAESYARLLEHNFTPEMYELQDEVKKLKEKVRHEQDMLYHSGKKREQEVGKAEYEASRARKDAKQASDKLKNLRKIATEEVDKLQKQLQDLKQHNEELHQDNVQLQKQNERLRHQRHGEAQDRRHAQMVQANELLKEECAQMHTENARLHHEFHEMQRRWEIERAERVKLTEDNQQWQQSNEARQAYMELTIESLTVAQERAEGMIMEINAINWGIGSKVLYSPYLEVLGKAKARFEQVVEFATRVKREQRIWLRKANCPIDTEMKALQEKIEEEEEE